MTARRDDLDPASRRLALNKALIKLILASVVLNALILTGFFMSTPEHSAASAVRTAVYKARFKFFPIKDSTSLAHMHLKSAQIPKAECEACHGDELDSRIVLHRIHLRSELLPGLVCNDCHRRVDLAARDNVVVTRWVDVGVCKKCHSPFPGLKPGSAMTPTDFKIDCTTCHTGSNAPRHEETYLSQIIAPAECTGCHGKRVLPWTPLHERADWLKKHGAEALQSGTKDCFQCHDFGLKFCDTCHAIKPPTHLPADRWKAVHADAARADTRACYTCHKINFCKTCHVVHESGWRDLHPAFVDSHGTKSCEKCHSLSFCSFCHTGLPTPLRDSSPSP